MNIWWIGFLQDASREAVAGRWMVRSLQALGHAVAAQALPGGAPLEINAELAAYMNAALHVAEEVKSGDLEWDPADTAAIFSDSALVELAQHPEATTPQADHRIGWWVRSTLQLPEEIITFLNTLDAIWTPYPTYQATLREQGVTIPIAVTGLPYYPLYPDEIARLLRAGSESAPNLTGTHRFLATGFYAQSQNWASLLRTYWQAFQPTEDVALYLKTYAGPREEDAVGPLRDLRRATKQWGRPIPPTYLWPWRTAEPIYTSLFPAMHTVLALDTYHVSGITIIESLYAGCPVIATPFGVSADLVTPENGWIVRSEQEAADAMREACQPSIWQQKSLAARETARAWVANEGGLHYLEQALDALTGKIMPVSGK